MPRMPATSTMTSTAEAQTSAFITRFQVRHDLVVGVGVGPQALAVLQTPGDHSESLRADTHADNKIMQHLLEKNGFARCSIIHVEAVSYTHLPAS